MEEKSANVSCPKTLFLVNSVYTNNVSVFVFITLVILRAKFHVVSSRLSVFKNSDFDAIVNLPQALPLKMSLTQK